MFRRRPPGQIVLFAGILISAYGSPSSFLEADKQNPPRPLAVREADLIVVARVVGLIDTKPVAHTRRHLEASWIHVRRTLKGSDETGQRLRAQPNGQWWEAGKSYVLLLKRREGDWVEAVPGQPIAATTANIAAAAREVTAQGGSVLAKRVLSMKHTGGWGTGPIAEFFVTADGAFEWRQGLQTGQRVERKPETRTGRLSKDTVARLIGQVARTGPGLAADDAGMVTFHWLDAQGRAQSKTFSTPDQPPCSQLLETVQTLARRYGRAPRDPTR